MGLENEVRSEEEGLVRLEILVEADTMREIEEVVQERGWELAEGVRLLLGSGLAYVKGERVLQAVESGSMSQDDLQRMLSRMVETETRLAALRFRTWEAQQANQAWELSTGAIRNENQGLRSLVQRLRDENMALQAENAQLRSLLPVPLPDLPAQPLPAAPPSVWRSLWHGWQRRLRRTPKRSSQP